MTPFAVLADGPTGEAAKSGPWGLAIILLLCAGCYFLFKSMSKHLRKVREQFPRDGGQPAGQSTDGAATDGAATDGPATDGPATEADAAPAPATPSPPTDHDADQASE